MNFKATGASSGIAIAKIFKLEEYKIEINKETNDKSKEVTLLEHTIKLVIFDIEKIKKEH